MSVTVDRPRMTEKSTKRTALAFSSAVLTALVLVQAILAGRGWFVNYDLIDIHGVMGDITLLAAIVQVAIAGVAMRRQRATRALFGLSLATLVLVFAQLALGYAANESATAASLHIPNGVLIFGLSVAMTVLAWNRGQTT
jgi:hypothetical protein